MTRIDTGVFKRGISRVSSLAYKHVVGAHLVETAILGCVNAHRERTATCISYVEPSDFIAPRGRMKINELIWAPRCEKTRAAKLVLRRGDSRAIGEKRNMQSTSTKYICTMPSSIIFHVRPRNFPTITHRRVISSQRDRNVFRREMIDQRHDRDRDSAILVRRNPDPAESATHNEAAPAINNFQTTR